jgi:hypothetical protein
MVVPKVQILRTATPNQPPQVLAPGEFAIEMASTPPRLWIGVDTAIDPVGMKMLLPIGAVIVDDLAPTAPINGALWWESDTGIMWMWYNDGDTAQWVQVNGLGAGGGASVSVDPEPPSSPNKGDLWWEADTGILWVWYEDVDTAQWVQTAGHGGGGGTAGLDQATADDLYVNIVGDTMTGDLILAHDPVLPLEAATKQYVDATLASVTHPAFPPAPVVFSFSGKPVAGAKIIVPAAQRMLVPANLAGSIGRVGGSSSTATAAFTLAIISGSGTRTVGTISVSGYTITFSGAGGTVEIGDALRLQAPSAQDATLTDLGITILTERV